MVGKAQAISRRLVRSQKERQTRLQFSPLTSSSPAKDGYSQTARDRLASVRYEGGSETGYTAAAADDNTLPAPNPSSQVNAQMIPDNSSPLSDLPSSSPRLQAPGPTPDTEQEDEDDLILPSSKRRRTTTHATPWRRSSRLQNASSTIRTTSYSSPSVLPFLGAESPSPSRGRDLSDLGSPETSGDEGGAVLASRGTQRARRPAPKATYYSEPIRSRLSHGDDFVAADDEVEYITSGDEIAAGDKPRKSSRSGQTPKTPRRRTREEQQELDADVDDLLDSSNEESAQRRRTRGGPVTTERDKAREYFELLRRRRAGEKIPRVAASDDENTVFGEDMNLIGQPKQNISYEDSVQSSLDTDPDNKQEPLQDDDDQDDFIEDDMTDRRGRPHPDVPLEFTHFASSKASELFVHIIEWLVKNKISPAFARNDALYRLALNKVDDQVKAQAGSRLISSAWNATFKYTILARPNVSITALPGLDEDNLRTCDACNKSNRPARYDFVLLGEAYSVDTLEAINDSDDEDDAYGDGADRDEAGHVLARQEQHFYLGSHCAANAQMGHKLTHWKYHLNEAVLQYLEEQGVLSTEAILARDKLNNKKREKEAEAIVDAMEASGKISELWKDFHNDLDDARLGMEDYQKKGGRSYGRIGVIRSSGADGIMREWKDNKYKETIQLDSDSE